MNSYSIGVTHDAIAIVETVHPILDETTDSRLMFGERRRGPARHHVVRVDTFPTGTSYAAIVQHVVRRVFDDPIGARSYANGLPLRDDDLPRPIVMVTTDARSRPLVEMLRDRGMWRVQPIDLEGTERQPGGVQGLAASVPVVAASILLARGRVKFGKSENGAKVRAVFEEASPEGPFSGSTIATAIAIYGSHLFNASVTGIWATKAELGLQ